MLRSILVALDDTAGATAARDAAIALARAHGAALTGAIVLDRPHNASDHEAVPVGGAAFKARRDAKLAAAVETEAEATSAAFTRAADGLRARILRLEDAPEPALVQAGASHDLILLGRDCTLGGEAADGGVAPVVEALLHEGGRPLLVMPPQGRPDAARADGPVVVADDGSAPAREAARRFLALGLAGSSKLVVAAVAATRAEAQAMAEAGAAALRAAGAAAEPLALVGDDPAALLPQEIARLGARMLVMGAFGSGRLARLLSGSTTHRLLRDAGVPVFIEG
jgi:nucleotide-binding universal stress UspA family protein